MRKAVRKGASAVCRLYVDKPGDIQCQMTVGGEHMYTWTGGEIAAIKDECVAPVVWLDNGGMLPWGIDWIEHDDDNNRWYVRRQPKEQSDEKSV